MDALFGVIGPVPPRHWRETRLLARKILERACADLGQKGITMFAMAEATPHVPAICASYPAYAPWYFAVADEWRTLKRTNTILATIHGRVEPEKNPDTASSSGQEAEQNRPLLSRDGRLAVVFTVSDDDLMTDMPEGCMPLSKSDHGQLVIRMAEMAQSPMVGLAVILDQYSGVMAVALVDLEERIVWVGHSGVEQMLLVRMDTRVLISTHPKSLLEGFTSTVGAERIPTGPQNVTPVATRTAIGISMDTGEIIVPD